MNKNNRRILLVCLPLLALMAAALWLLLLAPDEPDPPPEEVIPVYATGLEISGLEMENVQGHIHLQAVPDGEGAISYRVLDFAEDIPQYTGRILSLLSLGTGLNAQALVNEDTADLARYGLDPPSASVRFYYDDGSETTLLLGDGTPDGSTIYITARGDHLDRAGGAVYAARLSSLEVCLFSPEELVSPLITGVNAAAALFEEAVFSGSVREQPFVLRRQDGDAGSRYLLEEPIRRELASYYSVSELQYAYGLMAAEVVEMNPTDGDLARYGLDQPYSSLSLARNPGDILTGNTAGTTAEPGDLALHASAPDENGNAYVMRDGVPVVYSVPAASMPWLEKQFYDFVNPYLLSPAIADVAQVTVSTPESSRSFLLSPAEAVEDGEPALSVTLDDSPLDVEQFRPYYQTLVTGQTTDYSPDWDGAAPMAQITFRYHDGGGDVVTFYPGPVRSCYVALGDETPQFLINASYVERVLADANRLAQGETVTTYQ